MHNFDTIIIGGGPSGLQTIHFLSANNLKVALFEKDPGIRNGYGLLGSNQQGSIPAI